jgi:hypothetical protein
MGRTGLIAAGDLSMLRAEAHEEWAGLDSNQ